MRAWVCPPAGKRGGIGGAARWTVAIMATEHSALLLSIIVTRPSAPTLYLNSLPTTYLTIQSMIQTTERKETKTRPGIPFAMDVFNNVRKSWQMGCPGYKIGTKQNPLSECIAYLYPPLPGAFSFGLHTAQFLASWPDRAHPALDFLLHTWVLQLLQESFPGCADIP